MISSSHSDIPQTLEHFNTYIAENDLVQNIIGPEAIDSESTLKFLNGNPNQFDKIIEGIKQTGDIQPYDWKSIKLYLALRLKKTLIKMNENYGDMPNESEINFEAVLKSIMNYFAIFEEKAPFTIQRLCELILEPNKYYKSSRKLTAAIEKRSEANYLHEISKS